MNLATFFHSPNKLSTYARNHAFGPPAGWSKEAKAYLRADHTNATWARLAILRALPQITPELVARYYGEHELFGPFPYLTPIREQDVLSNADAATSPFMRDWVDAQLQFAKCDDLQSAIGQTPLEPSVFTRYWRINMMHNLTSDKALLITINDHAS